MKTIEEQFKKLTQDENNPAEIRKLIGTSEDLYLECKTIAKDEIENDLITDKHHVSFINFGKCISAFANAEGGIVIWGLFAKEKKSSPDLINEERPIKNVIKVKTDFDSIIGKVVSRRVVGVQNKIVYTDRTQDLGFIVTYIPKSDEAPHRVEGERKESGRYYRRHGSGSYEMEHFELEEMFGGRSSPKLLFVISTHLAIDIYEKAKQYNIKFGMKNVGKAIAKYPFLEIVIKGSCNLTKHAFGIDGGGHTGLPPVRDGNCKYQGGVSDIIHIDDILWVDQLTFNKDIHFESQEQICFLTVKIACDGFRMRTRDLSFDLRNLIKSSEVIEYGF